MLTLDTSLEFNALSIIVIFLLGISLGSFLNVVVDRFATGRSLVKGRSYCESCKRTIEIIDLIPVLSYVILRGRCRFCKKKIPLRIFLVEIFTGIITVYVFLFFGSISIISLISIYVLTLLFIAIFFIDLEYGIIPDKLTVLLTIVASVFVISSGADIFNHLFSALGSLLFFIGLFVVTKGKGMGLGDVKVSFALGLVLGFPLVIYGLYIAFLTGAFISIILVLWRKKTFRSGTVPFGPFLTASTLFTIFFGKTLILPLANLIF